MGARQGRGRVGRQSKAVVFGLAAQDLVHEYVFVVLGDEHHRAGKQQAKQATEHGETECDAGPQSQVHGGAARR